MTKYIVSVVLVYGGLLLLMRVWLRLAEVMKLHAGAPLKKLWWIFALWAVPMIVAPPLFSPRRLQLRGPGRDDRPPHQPVPLRSLHAGRRNPYVNPVDPLWGNTPAPYGPFFLSSTASSTGSRCHHELWTVVGLRLLEVLAVVLIGYGVAHARAGPGP